MSGMISKGILIVSFGTSYADTRTKTIDEFVRTARAAYEDYYVYEAWTSRVIANILMKRDGIYKQTVTEALQLMIDDGIREVIIQPTHVINGLENEAMKAQAEAFRDQFDSMKFGTPLLTSDEDLTWAVNIMTERFKGIDPQEEGVVLMGHGTTHKNNAIYSSLYTRFKELGHDNYFVGTVESWPGLKSIVKAVKKTSLKKVYLIPFMMVAGDHANNDMAGDDHSWKQKFLEEGYQVECIMEGLCENPAIRKLLIDHMVNAGEE